MGMLEKKMAMMGNTDPWKKYIQDGLVFQLDCDAKCTAAQWEDLKGGMVFTGNGVQLINGIPYFSNSAFYETDSALNYSYNECTLEVALLSLNLIYYYTAILNNSFNGGVGLIFGQNELKYGTGNAKGLRFASTGTFSTLSINEDNYLIDGVSGQCVNTGGAGAGGKVRIFSRTGFEQYQPTGKYVQSASTTANYHLQRCKPTKPLTYNASKTDRL